MEKYEFYFKKWLKWQSFKEWQKVYFSRVIKDGRVQRAKFVSSKKKLKLFTKMIQIFKLKNNEIVD